MQKPDVMVLGATGFIGSHVARAFERRGYPVHGTRRATSDTSLVDDLDLTWHQVDLDDGDGLDEALEACQALVDCAAVSPSNAVEIDAAKRRGVGRLRNVLDACERQRIGRVVYVSSPTTLGSDPSSDDGLLTEDDFYVPGTVEDAYFETKFSIEAETYRYLLGGLHVVNAIPTAVFGPGDANPGVSGLLIRLVEGGLPALLDGTFNAVDVRDVADTIVAALEHAHAGRRYIIGGENVGIPEFARMAAEIRGVEPPGRLLPGEPTRRAASFAEKAARALGYEGESFLTGIDMMHYARPVSSERAEGELHHDPRPLESTIRDTLDWFETHGYLS